ncbi:hypothetical protein G5I_02233 [Acromyrmex echinatior]|uniref:Uncharacterized protein n=1 Tax=Acromyrmex echinatior TaxID=103372 RepID=F4W9S6_ACREC|nr:hypothetical protein G5I_02233 [Acromyrmex echinatior]
MSSSVNSFMYKRINVATTISDQEMSSALFLEEKRLTQTVKSSASTKAGYRKSPISVRGEGEDPEKWTTSNLRPTS